MNVLLLDVDSKIPNLALMKISAFHKLQGDKIHILKLNLSYYPCRKKRNFHIPSFYDRVYVSIIFPENKKYIYGDSKKIIRGGTGFDIHSKLPEEIESYQPDYGIYGEKEYSYGFLSRGCIRKCSFCFVPEKEGELRQVAMVDEICKLKKTRFMDNNFLALPNHKEILSELIRKKIRFCFYQGLDIRLIDEENAWLLSECRYLGDYIFAFDDLSYKKIIEQKMNILRKFPKMRLQMFIYCHPKMEPKNYIRRLEWCKVNSVLPYFMRDRDCYSDEKRDLFNDLAAWANQPAFFKRKTFPEFLEVRHKDLGRIRKHSEIYVQEV